MNSLRLQGLHRLMGGLPVQIDATDHWEWVPQLQSDENPVLKRGTQLVLTLPQGVTEGYDAGTWRDTASKAAVFEFVVACLRQGSLDIVTKDEARLHKRDSTWPSGCNATWSPLSGTSRLANISASPDEGR